MTKNSLDLAKKKTVSELVCGRYALQCESGSTGLEVPKEQCVYGKKVVWVRNMFNKGLCL